MKLSFFRIGRDCNRSFRKVKRISTRRRWGAQSGKLKAQSWRL